MRLIKLNIDHKDFNFSKDNESSQSNTYTVLTGKNGSGKSKIFYSIIKLFYDLNYRNRHTLKLDYNHLELEFEQDYQNSKLEVKREIELKLNPYKFTFYKNNKPSSHMELPRKIIAVTSSPFDKFYRPKNSDEVNFQYIYRGSKRSQGEHTIDFLEFKFKQLGNSFIELFDGNIQQKTMLMELFKLIGLGDDFKLIFHVEDDSIDYFLAALDEYNEIEQTSNYKDESLDTPFDFEIYKPELLDYENDFNFEHEKNSDNYSNFESEKLEHYKYYEEKIEQLEFIENKKKIKAENIVQNLAKYLRKKYINGKQTIECKFDLSLKNESRKFRIHINDMAFLCSRSMLRLSDIEFIKDNEKLLLSNASSGEQCLLFNFLSISSEISDNSLVLIDEPELSLHPAWQEKFIYLLDKMFNDYYGCHFIIATHSPHIVSSLPEENSYLLNIEDNIPKLIEGSELSNKSTDYQISKVFGVNHSSNEYIIRVAMNIFAYVNKNRIFTDDFKDDMVFLKEIHETIEKETELYNLISMLKFMEEMYA